jgi:hypothetical protein
MTFEQPPRLKDSPELGAVIRAAGEANVTPERLADNAAGVKALIASGATTALWKLILPLLLLAAIVAPIAVKLATPADEPPPPPPPAAPVAVAPAVVPDAPEAVPDPIDATEPPPPPAPRRHATPVPVDAAVIVEDAPAAKSELAAQIELYRAARDAGVRGDVAHGIELIDDLLRQYPATPLRAEADLTRADFLARANRLDEAARAVEELLRDAAHGGRRGELLRTLGDLYRRQGDCTRAIDAYTRALAERLSERDRADVERGRDRCTPR